MAWAKSAKLAGVLQYLLSPEALVVLCDLLVQEHQVIQCYPCLPGSQYFLGGPVNLLGLEDPVLVHPAK